MKRNFSKRVLTSVILLLFLGAPSVFAATLTIEAVNVTGRNLAAFIMNWDGITNSSFTSGPAITAWFTALNDNTPEDGVTQLEAADTTQVLPMVDGLIGTLTFEGNISWSDVQFSEGWEFRKQGNVVDRLMVVTGEPADGAKLVASPVPIPAAIFLLGGGLISLMAVRRRRS